MIAEFAKTVQEAYKIEMPIRNMGSVIQHIGGRVIDDFSIHDSGEWKTEKISENTFAISISATLNEAQRNFALACALGYLFLQMGFKTDSTHWKGQHTTVSRVDADSRGRDQIREFAMVIGLDCIS